MILVIGEVTRDSFGDYFCISKNALGTSEGVVRIYRKFEIKCFQFIKIFRSYVI